MPHHLISGSAFLPTDLSGLKLWLDAARGITKSGGVVSAWADQTTNSNGCSEATKKPSFVSNALNGQPGIHIVGDTILSSTTSIVTSSHARTTFIVVANPIGVSAANLFSYRLVASPPTHSLLWDPTTDIFTDNNNAAFNQKVPAQTYAQNFILESSWDGNTAHLLTFKVSGNALTVSNPGAGGTSSDTGGAGYQVGQTGWPSGWGADICEILCYDSVLSTANASLVRQCLASRYRLTVVP